VQSAKGKRQREEVATWPPVVGDREVRSQESEVRSRTPVQGLFAAIYSRFQSKIQNPKSKTENPEPRIPNPEPRLRNHWHIIGGLVLLILLTAVGAAAATIEGTVFDPSGQPVPGARVNLLAGLAPVAERQSDTQGHFRFENLPANAYRLIANVPGFAASARPVEVAEGETRSVDLRLALSAVEEHVVVSASLGGVLAPQVGSSLSVLERNDIEERGAQSVLEVLRDVPGVAVSEAGRRGGATGVFIRGGNSNYNLVMIDGIQVNQFGGDFDFAPLPAEGVDRVEIVRGPQSALYGSNAVTGVINIVTRRGEGPPHFTVLAGGGSFTTRRFATGGSGLTRGLSWAYNLSRLDSGGVVPNDGFRNQSAFLSLGYSRSPRRQVNLHFFGNANDAGSPGPFGSDPLGVFPGIDLTSRNKQNLFGYQASYSEQFSPRFRQVVSGSVSTNDYYFRTPFGDSYSTNLRGVVNTRSELTISSRDFLVFGFEYNREQAKNTFIADDTNTPFLLPRTSYAYFAENRWNPTRRWVVIAGVRVDDIRTHQLPPDAFGSRPLLPASSITKVNPRLSATYLAREGSGAGRWGATRLHGSFGTGIRAPSGFELAFTNNPRLKPEKSLSFDAGVEQRFLADRAVIDATYFYNRFRDQIVVLGSSLSNLSSFTSDNLANARSRGVEFSVRLHPVRSLDFAANYTRLDSAILALDGTTTTQSPFEVGQPLIRRPRNSGSLNATWSHGRLMLNLNGTWRTQVLDVEPNFGAFGGLFPNNGYFVANTGFAYRLPRGVELYGRLNNVLNRKYEEALGFPALHLNFLTGVRFTFPAE
jgi:outer membrane receptor protein involved in Fe transport